MARILVIDDEPSIRAGVCKFLRALSHDVVEAGNGLEALRIVDREPPDLVITDINMPEMDGIEVIMALAERGHSLPVIAVSGGGRLPKNLLLTNAHLLGAVSVVEKPFDLTALQSCVDQALAGAPV